MKYEIIGDTFQVVVIEMRKGEKIYSQSGVLYMDDGIQFTTSAYGGIIRGIKRVFIKETYFMNEFAVTDAEKGTVALMGDCMGKIVDIPITPDKQMIVQKRAFVCAEDGVRLDIAFTKKIGAGLFGGQGFVFQHLSGNGMAFLKVVGDVLELDLKAGERIRVDTGLIVGFERSVNYDIAMVRGIKSIFFGGEGLFFSSLTGPGTVYLQSFDMKRFIRDMKSEVVKV